LEATSKGRNKGGVMARYKLSQMPTTFLRQIREAAKDNARQTLIAWGNPVLSDEEQETLELLSLIILSNDPKRFI
jgi:hypothetical protein